jgi:hypothetical protein
MMASNRYSFVTEWHVPATCAEVSDILGDALDLPRWWPDVYLEARELKPGAPVTHVGREVALHTRGWLPYTLRWNFRVVDNRHPHGFAIEAWGDFEGTGVWTLTAEEGGCHVRFDWNILAEKPLLKWFSFVMKPIFSWNHAWAMKKGEASLRRELERRKKAA